MTLWLEKIVHCSVNGLPIVFGDWFIELKKTLTNHQTVPEGYHQVLAPFLGIRVQEAGTTRQGTCTKPEWRPTELQCFVHHGGQAGFC